jgi:hypothetical protein
VLGGEVPAFIDARCEGIGKADVVFVFGTRAVRPAHLAADLFHRGHARWSS